MTPTPIDAYKQGIRYSYYTTSVSWSDLPNFSTLTPAKTGLLQNFSLTPRTQSTNYGFSYTGYIKIDRVGTYMFYTLSDDGSRLWINDKLVVENGGVHSLRERAGSINLTAGYHLIKVEYFQARSSQGLGVAIAGPRMTKRTIPNSMLFYK